MPFEESSIPWDEDAKSFAEGTMDLAPPGVRSMVEEQLIKVAEQIAKEQDAPAITTDIFAEAVQIIGKGLPQNVRDLLPKDPSDLDREKVPIDPDQLSGE